MKSFILTKEQTEQLINDLKQFTPITTVNFWKESIKTWKQEKDGTFTNQTQ